MSSENKSVPSFLIKLNGSRLPIETEDKVKEITVIERVNSPSTFTIIFSDPEKELCDSDDFTEGTLVKISVGYKDDLQEVFSGEITGVSPYYQNLSNMSLCLKGSDKLHRLNRGKKTVSFSNMSEGDIVKQIASNIQLKADVASIGESQPFILQKNLTDFEYLQGIAKKYDCTIWCQDDTFYFQPIKGGKENTIVEWEKTLISFQPVLDARYLPTEVEVRGWDPSKFEAVVGSAKAGDVSTKIGGSTLGLKNVEDNFGAEKMIYVDESIIDTNTADTVAKNILTGLSFNYVTGKGKTEGNNLIRAASLLKINGVGERFSGLYYVEQARHHFTPQMGYHTHFSVKRNAIP